MGLDESREPVDPLPAMLAAIDQALKMVGEQARVTKAHYDAYIEQGFNNKQALYLAAMFWKQLDAPDEGA
jgi:hypothetical protein